MQADLLDWNATAATLWGRLEELPEIDEGDVVVRLGRTDEGFPGIWSVEFTGQYAGNANVPLLQIFNDSVTDAAFKVRRVNWKPNGDHEEIGCVLPLDEPLSAGSVVTAGWYHGFGYAVVGVECRSFAVPAAYGS